MFQPYYLRAANAMLKTINNVTNVSNSLMNHLRKVRIFLMRMIHENKKNTHNYQIISTKSDFFLST